MESVVVGRESELAAAERFLDAVSSGTSALVIEGEAGIVGAASGSSPS